MADAWYGENETYGTLVDFLEGENLLDEWGNDPSWGMRPTYTNAVSELVGENPVSNLFVDSRGILSQGGGPDLYDWLALGVSGIPGVGPTLSAANKYVTRPIWQNIQAASQSRFNPSLETALRSKGYDPSKTLNELSVPETPSIFQISADEWDVMEPLIKNQWLQREGLAEGDVTVFHYLNEGKEKLLAASSLAEKYGDKELLDTISKGIAKTDDLILNWPETPFIKNLKEGDGPTEKVVSNFRRIKRADKLTKEFAMTEKTGMKPSHVDATEWEKLTADLTTEETLNLAKRMTLKNSFKLIQ